MTIIKSGLINRLANEERKEEIFDRELREVVVAGEQERKQVVALGEQEREQVVALGEQAEELKKELRLNIILNFNERNNFSSAIHIEFI